LYENNTRPVHADGRSLAAKRDFGFVQPPGLDALAPGSGAVAGTDFGAQQMGSSKTLGDLETRTLPNPRTRSAAPPCRLAAAHSSAHSSGHSGRSEDLQDGSLCVAYVDADPFALALLRLAPPPTRAGTTTVARQQHAAAHSPSHPLRDAHSASDPLRDAHPMQRQASRCQSISLHVGEILEHRGRPPRKMWLQRGPTALGQSTEADILRPVRQPSRRRTVSVLSDLALSTKVLELPLPMPI
jgi:hypothetical protein